MNTIYYGYRRKLTFSDGWIFGSNGGVASESPTLLGACTRIT
ncbi:hypothetical protein [Scytonema sp. NUACC26]